MAIPFFILINSNCNNQQQMTEPKILTYDQAMKYIIAYAKFEGVDIEEGLSINNKDEIRGKIGAAEFQYLSVKHLLITRGLIDKRLHEADSEFRERLLFELKQMYAQDRKSFEDYSFEYDTTAHLLNPEFPERLNFRYDISDGHYGEKEFVKRIDEMMTFTYKFYHNKYNPLIEKVYQSFFTEK
jgi:hypothetical protein